MGIYLNPGNDLFRQAVKSKIYVDKSMMICNTNSVLDTSDKHICISRPRRFGKSMAANMLAAYYDRKCDSRNLFENLAVSQTPDFETHLNKYDVIRLDISNFVSEKSDPMKTDDYITEDLLFELKKEYPYIEMPPRLTLDKALATVYMETGIPFVFIIDEWDCIFRIFPDNNDAHKVYLDFLRDLLKDRAYVALNYATGIFPVKKYGKHSALNMYQEFSINDAAPYSEFMGFTEDETEALCKKYSLSFDEMKEWYNGYQIDGNPMYNPQSVVLACNRKKFSNYWTKTETFEALKVFIQLDMDGLRDSVIRMISGEKVRVNTETFQNDMTTFSSADDVITLLIHLGYLTYDNTTNEAWIPNKEVGQEFINCIKDGGWEEVMNAVRKSDDLLTATLNCDEKKVAEIIEEVHRQNSSIIAYNNELSLSVTLALAYYSARKQYEIIREFPSGEGFADLAFIPRKGVNAPAIVAELKYNKSAEGAVSQIKDRNYTDKLTAFSGEILLVGINYDKESKKHECQIERIVK